MRRRVHEMSSPARPTGDDARRNVVAATRTASCPECKRGLAPRSAADLTPIVVAWRGLHGARPLSFEVACPGCGHRCIVHVAREGVTVSTAAAARAIRESVRDRERDAVASRVRGHEDE